LSEINISDAGKNFEQSRRSMQHLDNLEDIDDVCSISKQNNLKSGTITFF
jgi:hypothetical protein